MLPLPTVQEIRRLLNEGKLSQRKIAKKLGVSRGTVSALATGKRGDYGREPQESDTLAPPERCPQCGVMVHPPCVYCRAIAYRERLQESRKAA